MADNYRVACDASGRPQLVLERMHDCVEIRHVHSRDVFAVHPNEASWSAQFATLVAADTGRRLVGGGKLEKPGLAPRAFYPRVDRPGTRVGPAFEHAWGGGSYESFFFRYHAAARQATHLAALLLFHQFADVLEVVEPRHENASTYGHALRQLLILACTEVESGWQAVLRENGYKKAGSLTTKDYVKLLPLLRLNEWEVRLANHEHWPAIRPFGSWSAQLGATKSIPWYEDYNAVKHNREADLGRAKLESVVSAMAAVAIMAWAQFGEQVVAIESVPLSALFVAAARPAWNASEIYFGQAPEPTPEDPSKWHRVQLF